MSPVHILFLVCFQTAIRHVTGLNISFSVSNVDIYVDETVNVTVIFDGTASELEQLPEHNWTSGGTPPDVVAAEFEQSSIFCSAAENRCNGSLEIKGLFLGFGSVYISRKDPAEKEWIQVNPSLKVTVMRRDTLANKLFIGFVAAVMTINYINMGCALDLGIVRDVIKRPIGPTVAFVCQFVIMPLVSYGVGLLFFDDPVLRLGLFVFGTSPGGGASNMWTVLLEGNLSLSITMTFISHIAALVTIPLWLLTLGKTILEGTTIVIPFGNILASLASLTLPILVGIVIQRRYPKLAARSERILAPASLILLIIIIIMASIVSSYMFYMLTWIMIMASTLSVWTGFIAGILLSWFFRLPLADITAIAIETGIQNTGMAFLLLSYSLKAPVSDMAAVVPVAASIMTPIPLFALYFTKKVRNRCFRSQDFELQRICPKLGKSSESTETLPHKEIY